MREVSYGYCISSMSFQSEKYPNWSGIPTFLFLDLLCNIGLSVSGLRKIRFNAYTPVEFPQKKSVPKETRIPIVHVNNFRLVFKIINFRFVP